MFQKYYEFNRFSIFYKTREYVPSMRVRVRMGRSVSAQCFLILKLEQSKIQNSDQLITIYGLLIHKYGNYYCIRKNVD